MKLIHPSDNITTPWKGGITHQIYIYPENSSVENRDFSFRISTAEIQQEKSDFTQFNGYSRILMPLDKEIVIHHQDQYEKVLQALQQDVFSGDWNTYSKGKCIDFNLIFRPEFQGEMKVISMLKNKKYDLKLSINEKFKLLFVVQGELSRSASIYKKGDALVLESSDSKTENLTANSDCVCIQVRVL